MFRNVPECSGMLHVPDFIDDLDQIREFPIVSCRALALFQDSGQLSETNRLLTVDS